MRGRHKEIGNYAILVLLTTLLFLFLIVDAPPSRHPVIPSRARVMRRSQRDGES